MNVYRPLRLLILVYEAFRLLLMLGIFMAMLSVNRSLGNLFPYLLYIVPNALFLLMAYFLWRELERYAMYLPLFMAGKVISVVAIAGWCVGSFEYIIEAVLRKQVSSTAAAIAVLFMAGTDTLSILGVYLTQKKLNGLAVKAAVVTVSEEGM
ncbi:MAG: hypothetical protein LBS86_07570 [Treponema sp.]|jgi:hypothetical protein|nr:hypothetical protein [Treponema sp.]